MSSCARSSAVGLGAWGFAELDALRVEHDLNVSRFCRAVGLPARNLLRPSRPPRSRPPRPQAMADAGP